MSVSENREGGRVLLDVKHLTQTFGSGRNVVTAVRNVSFHINEGETYGLVGESGSGKSTIGRCIIGLNTPSAGSIRFDGTELIERGNGSRKGSGSAGREKAATEDTEKRRAVREEIQMIFQDPMSSLNPRKKIGDIIGAGLDIRKAYSSMEERNERIAQMLEKVGLSREQAGRYPGQFSGGQRQRVGIARALILKPKLIIADECIAALDASIQAQIVNMLKNIQKETGTAFLFISHDLSMVRYLSDRIGVLHLGYLLETGTTDEIFRNPAHPYTMNLLNAVPRPNPVMQFRTGSRYDYETSDILYENGSWHNLNGQGTHQLWCTDVEYRKWGYGDEDGDGYGDEYGDGYGDGAEGKD